MKLTSLGEMAHINRTMKELCKFKARPLLSQALEGQSLELVDPRLEEYNSSEMAQMIACAAVCIRSSARRRPQMSQVIRALEGNVFAADLLKEIHQITEHSMEKLALDSQEQSTGEYSVYSPMSMVCPHQPRVPKINLIHRRLKPANLKQAPPMPVKFLLNE